MSIIGVVTGSRADYGIFFPVIKEITQNSKFTLQLYVTGAHLDPKFGESVKTIEADGFKIQEKIEILQKDDSPSAIAEAIAKGVSGFSRTFNRSKPDLLLLLGDRYEMFSAAIAALPYSIPLGHIHGGELTEGAIDDAIRHALTKLSHLHFVANEVFRDRVVQLGEQPWRVTVTGAPSLDNLKSIKFLSIPELEKLCGISFEQAPIVATFHPETLAFDSTKQHIAELLEALREFGQPVIITYPGADTHANVIIEAITKFSQEYKLARVVKNLGTQAYFSLLKYARAMVGNSSSGIIEAASFHLPVLDLGDRQKGRLRAANVVHCEINHEAIVAGLKKVCAPAFKQNLSGLINPYGDGQAAKRIMQVLEQTPLDKSLLLKVFHDLS